MPIGLQPIEAPQQSMSKVCSATSCLTTTCTNSQPCQTFRSNSDSVSGGQPQNNIIVNGVCINNGVLLVAHNGDITKVSDFEIDFNNVIQIPQGKDLVLFPISGQLSHSHHIVLEHIIHRLQGIHCISISPPPSTIFLIL